MKQLKEKHLLLMLLPMLLVNISCEENEEECLYQKVKMNKMNIVLPYDCVETFIRNPNLSATIVWMFKGYKCPWSRMNISTLQPNNAIPTDEGEYICTITTTNDTSITRTMYINIQLFVSESEAVTGPYNVVLVLIVGVASILILTVFIWRHLRLYLTLYCHPNPAQDNDTDKCQYDIFIVYEDEASEWVWSILLIKLCDNGYTCFLPERDLLGGDQLVESIPTAIFRCRCILLVVTPCLLTNPWTTWSTYCAIHKALTSPFSIVALNLQESPEANKLLGILNWVKMIHVPTSCRLLQHRNANTVSIRLESPPEHTEMKLCRSNTTSREKLEITKDMRQGMCGLVCRSVCCCPQVARINDPERNFWQMVYSHIGLPSDHQLTPPFSKTEGKKIKKNP